MWQIFVGLLTIISFITSSNGLRVYRKFPIASLYLRKYGSLQNLLLIEVCKECKVRDIQIKIFYFLVLLDLFLLRGEPSGLNSGGGLIGVRFCSARANHCPFSSRD